MLVVSINRREPEFQQAGCMQKHRSQRAARCPLRKVRDAGLAHDLEAQAAQSYARAQVDILAVQGVTRVKSAQIGKGLTAKDEEHAREPVRSAKNVAGSAASILRRMT